MKRDSLRIYFPVLAMFLLCITLISCFAPSPGAPAAPKQGTKQIAEFSVDPISVTPKWLFAGDTATVSAVITNKGKADGTYKAVFKVDGQNAGEKEILIRKGLHGQVSFTISNPSKGIKSVAIGESKVEVNFYGGQPYDIQYDGYESQTSRPVLVLYAPEPYGQMVRFTSAAKPFRVSRLQVNALASFKSDADQQKKFTVNIRDSTGYKLWTKDFDWKIFPGGLSSTWQDLEVPNVPVENDFLVEIVSHTPANQPESATQGNVTWFGLGYNKSDYESRSSNSYQGKPVQSTLEWLRKINYCIRVRGEGGPNQVLYYDDAGADIFKAALNFSYVQAFSAPSYPFDLRLVQFYGYRDVSDAGDRTFTLKVVDKSTMTPVAQRNILWREIPYNVRSWVDIDTGGITCNHDFFIEITPNNSGESIWLGCDTTAKNRNSDMSANGSIITWRDWTDATSTDIKTYTRDNTKWMIRAGGSVK